jgi:SAM-dependent methyltransferase
MNLFQLSTKYTRPRQSAGAYGYTATKGGVESVSRSASKIVPFLFERFHPRSVLDIGCGTGDWLAEFQKCGILKLMGYDGAWVPTQGRILAPECYGGIDFNAEMPPPGNYDLAMCLEVAEHLEPAVGEKLVAFMCKNSGLILWSAAIPDQGGYEHINENYQEYWVHLFAAHGFRPFDLIRPHFWSNESVSFWYRQNALIFADEASQSKYNLQPAPFMVSVVHPLLYDREVNVENYPFKRSLSRMFKIFYFMMRRLFQPRV